MPSNRIFASAMAAHARALRISRTSLFANVNQRAYATRHGRKIPRKARGRRQTLSALLTACLALGTLSHCAKSEIVAAFPESFVGVGLELKIDGKHPVVVRPLAGGPADEAGLLPGDPIIEIDGMSTRDKSLGDVVMQLRGAPSSQVSVTVRRDGRKLTVVVLRRPMARGPQDDYESASPQP